MGAETWAAAAIVSSITSTGVGAIGQSNARKYQAAQAKEQAKIGRIQADQVDTSYRSELADTIANIRSMRASAGVGADSPSELAVIADQERKSTLQRSTAVGNKRIQAAQSAADAKFYSASANQALFGGALEGITALAKNRSSAG